MVALSVSVWGLCLSLLASPAFARPQRLRPRSTWTNAGLAAKSVSGAWDIDAYDGAASGQRWTRDGGYVSTIGSKTVQMNYDSLTCDNTFNNCNWFASNTLNYLDTTSGTVTDPQNNGDLCSINSQTGASENVWFTNWIGINDTHGVGWFFNHQNTQGEPVTNSGAAILDLSNPDSPVCTRLVDSLFQASATPMYGFHGAIQGIDNNVYLFGSDMSTSAVRGGWSTVYVARVAPSVISTPTAYMYWNGVDFVSDQTAAVPIMYDTVPGSVSYSNYHSSFLYLYPSNPFGAILGKTAPTPWGPWSNATTVYQGGLYYSPHVLPIQGLADGTFRMQFSTQDQATGNFYQRAVTVTWQ